jgi:hypothetical protein
MKTKDASVNTQSTLKTEVISFPVTFLYFEWSIPQWRQNMPLKLREFIYQHKPSLKSQTVHPSETLEVSPTTHGLP